MTNDGQRRLLERTEGVAELARLVGVSLQQMTKWRAGERKPRPENARRIHAALGVPVDAWTQVPCAKAPAKPAQSQPEASRGRPTSLDEIEEMLVQLRSTPPGLAERELAKRLSERRALLGLKSRIEYQERLAEDAIVRSHPRWAEIRGVLREVLAKYPEARADFRARLSALRAWEEAEQALELPDDEGDA